MTGQPTGTLSDAQIDALASLDAETIRAIGEAVDDAGGSGGMSRRQMLGVLAGLGGAGLATGYASREVTAQPTGDEGQIGQQGDRVEVWASEIDSNEVEVGNAARIHQGGGSLVFDTDPDGVLGTHNVIFKADGSTTLNAFMFEGSRGFIFRNLHAQYGGLPGLTQIDSSPTNQGIALRPHDGGRVGLWWDRSDNSKEWAFFPQSGDELTDQSAFNQSYRVIEFNAGGHLRGEAWAPQAQTSAGIAKFRDDFMGVLRDEWTHSGAGSTTFHARMNDGLGGAVALETSTSAEESVLTFDGFHPFRFDQRLTFRIAVSPRSAADLETRWGLQTDANNYVRFEGDGSANEIYARTASGGSETSTLLTSDLFAGRQYLAEIVVDPDAGEVNYRISDGEGRYPRTSDLSSNTETHTTNLPTGTCEPELAATNTGSTAQDVRIDYVWVEAERTARL